MQRPSSSRAYACGPVWVLQRWCCTVWLVCRTGTCNGLNYSTDGCCGHNLRLSLPPPRPACLAHQRPRALCLLVHSWLPAAQPSVARWWTGVPARGASCGSTPWTSWLDSWPLLSWRCHRLQSSFSATCLATRAEGGVSCSAVDAAVLWSAAHSCGAVRRAGEHAVTGVVEVAAVPS